MRQIATEMIPIKETYMDRIKSCQMPFMNLSSEITWRLDGALPQTRREVLGHPVNPFCKPHERSPAQRHPLKSFCESLGHSSARGHSGHFGKPSCDAFKYFVIPLIDLSILPQDHKGM